MTQRASIYLSAADAVDIVDLGCPSRFAERYRDVKIGTSERPGRWSNAVFPHLTGIMDAVGEAIATGKRGVVLMKSGQGGGSEAMINALVYLKSKYAGPILYMISKDDLAVEFGRERFGHIFDTCEPIRKKVLRGKSSGETLKHKRFTDGKLDLLGGRSFLNLQSQPYRFVFVDEVDSLMDEIKNQGDPIKLLEVRMDAYEGTTLLVAFAHPSTPKRGAGKLYYEQSDQRRGFVSCCHCQKEFWLSFDHVGPEARFGLTLSQAEHRADCWVMRCPECHHEITDADRWRMIAAGVTYRTTLSDEEADRRTFIGVHFSQLYYPHKTLREFVAEYLAARGNESAMMVFENKKNGEPYEPKVQEVTGEDWRRNIIIPRDDDDEESWQRGEVPRGVRFLTAGQDSRSTELHWVVWGWGVRKGADGLSALCGRLIDFGVVARKYSLELDARELAVFDQLIYGRLFTSVTDKGKKFQVVMGGHDVGWNFVAVNEYCRRQPQKTLPVKGGNETSRSQYPAIRPGTPLAYVINGQRIQDDRVRPLILNTYQLKIQFFGMLSQKIDLPDGDGATPRPIPRLSLPADMLSDSCGERFITESSAEKLESVPGRGDVKAWNNRGRPNHFLDCNVYALACALNVDPFQRHLPLGTDDAESQPKKIRRGVVGKAFA